MTVQDSKHAIFDIPLSKEVTYKGAAMFAGKDRFTWNV